ncbi:hypothetical protein T4B_12961 [Trichinella pseudospiralis]|uniref:Uncharacterized protein n=1 Tax=Trichinella pseudospiralis TaxID=6337 RepID=A0A0V1G851_TRIPS|nr:hypothetical protein T4B_12961 [Trichinella pseudospiralis]
MPKLMKGATPSKLVKGVTAIPETTPFHHYVNCEFS